MSITEFTKKLLNMNTNFFTVYCIFKSPICNVDLRRGYFKDYFEATFFANILDEIYNSQDFPYIIYVNSSQYSTYKINELIDTEISDDAAKLYLRGEIKNDNTI